jgi:hypothetical protein
MTTGLKGPSTQSGLFVNSPLVMTVTHSSDEMHPRNNGTEAVQLQSYDESFSPKMEIAPRSATTRESTKIFDDAALTAGYESVPLLKIDTLPRGGISFETKGVGRVQVSLLSLDCANPTSLDYVWKI